MRARVLVRVGVAGAVLAGVAALAVPVVLGSDLANTATSTSVAPPEPGLSALPGALHRRWQAGGFPPGGGPAVQSGIVVVATTHRLEGRDPASGATRWYYERRNATLCSWATEGGRVFAAFRKAHGCRDLVALNAGTGARAWNRNAELDADITLTAMPSVLVAANPHGMVAFDSGSSVSRWTYGKPGCTLSVPVPGDAGLGVLASCGGRPQLVLVDAFRGTERFRPIPVGSAARVLSTVQSVAVLSGGAQRPTITLYGQAGTRLASFSDPRLRYADPARAGAAVYSGLILGWTGRAAFAVPLGSPRRLLWALDGAGPLDPADGKPLAADRDGFSQLELTTGRVTRTFPVPHGPLVGVIRVGSLVVASATDGTVVYG